MGRNARLKRERREARQRSLNEAWSYFTSRHFLKEVRKMILDSGANVNSCIACTKVYCQLAETVGLDVRPLTVETSVFNPVFAEWIQKNGLDPTQEQMEQLGKDGGRYVVLGARDEREPKSENAWPGHLVAVLSAKGKPTTVIDLSIDQADRPQKQIHVSEPLVFGAPQGFTKGKAVATGFCGTESGLNAILYRAFPDDTSFEVSPDWQRDYGAKAQHYVPKETESE